MCNGVLHKLSQETTAVLTQSATGRRRFIGKRLETEAVTLLRRLFWGWNKFWCRPGTAVFISVASCWARGSPKFSWSNLFLETRLHEVPLVVHLCMLRWGAYFGRLMSSVDWCKIKFNHHMRPSMMLWSSPPSWAQFIMYQCCIEMVHSLRLVARQVLLGY